MTSDGASAGEDAAPLNGFIYNPTSQPVTDPAAVRASEPEPPVSATQRAARRAAARADAKDAADAEAAARQESRKERRARRRQERAERSEYRSELIAIRRRAWLPRIGVALAFGVAVGIDRHSGSWFLGVTAVALAFGFVGQPYKEWVAWRDARSSGLDIEQAAEHVFLPDGDGDSARSRESTPGDDQR